MIDYEKLSNDLRSKITTLKISGRKAALLTDVPHASLYRVLKGEIATTLPNVTKVVKFLGGELSDYIITNPMCLVQLHDVEAMVRHLDGIDHNERCLMISVMRVMYQEMRDGHQETG